MSRRVALACVPESRVGSPHLLALAVCERASRDLGLGAVAIRWLAPAHEEGFDPSGEAALWKMDDFCGFVRATHPGTIFLRLGLSLPQVVSTTAHECRHLWQSGQHGSWDDWWMNCGGERDRADQEADAAAYAERFARELGWWGVEAKGG